jgi:hypothetical protein
MQIGFVFAFWEVLWEKVLKSGSMSGLQMQWKVLPQFLLRFMPQHWSLLVFFWLHVQILFGSVVFWGEVFCCGLEELQVR